MCRKAVCLLLFVAFAMGNGGVAWGQFYNNGRAPVDTRWEQIKSQYYKLVYPVEFGQTAYGLSAFLDSIAPAIRRGYSTPPKRLPIVLYTQNLQANGEVVWAPKRTELMTPAAPDGIHADLWLKQLAVHEARHNVQLSALRGGLTKVASVVLGQAGMTIGMLTLPKWFLEGDAVLAETQFSEFGRGLQPRFTAQFRAFLAGDSSRVWMPTDRWSCGSYRHYIPGIYEFGYQMVSAGERYFGTQTWDHAVEYAGKYPILFVPMRIYFRKHYRTSTSQLIHRALGDLRDWWEPYSAVEDSYRIVTRPGRSYTTYADPVGFRDLGGEARYAAVKSDFDTPTRLVTGAIHEPITEKRLAWIAPPSSRPAVDGQTLYWTEYKPHPVWEFKNYSVVRSLDLRSGKPGKTFGRRGANYFVTVIRRDGALHFATVSPDPIGGSQIVLHDQQFRPTERLLFPPLTSLHGLAWDARTEQLVFIALDERGMWLGARSIDGVQQTVELTPPSMVTISGLSADGKGSVYFSSIQSGKDEIHAFDLLTRTQRRLTTSRFGAYTPVPIDSTGELLLATYTPQGAMLGRASLPTGAAAGDTVAHRRLPQNLLNIPGPAWADVPKLSDFSLLSPSADSAQRVAHHPAKRYHKALRWFNVHSWVPGVGLDAEQLIDERTLRLAFGASLFFQSVMGDSYGGLGYGYLSGDHWVNGVWTYAGLPVNLELSTEYGGGKQTLYSSGATLITDRDAYWRTSLTASVPLNLSGGANLRLLQPSLRVTHYNALLFDPRPATQSLREGYEQYTASIWWSSNRRTASRSILPRLGYALRADVTGAFNPNFGTLYALYARSYLPGIDPTHTLTLKAGAMYQTRGLWNFNQKPLFPRGSDNRWAARRYAAAGLDYTLPLWCPDGGIPGLIYFKRLWMNLFADYARGEYFDSRAPSRLYSYGLDLAIEVNPISTSMPITLKFSVANTSDLGLRLSTGLSFDF